ncbi:Aspartic proteinase CDR1 [Acorus gramineus]|uniref:Aspartic proteinase CDR1 n=1 Tax=Acorus gramineus TaxID=55184 RepID=A0AAV9A807_ACOGR|nr:Aspartic proteinase CDR1 [Acorus gramineus]
MAAIKLLLLLSIITSTSALPINTPKSFSAKLIHRDSPNSPLYNPTATFSDRRKSAHQRSLQRYNYLLRRQRKQAITPQVQSPVFPDVGEYLMELTVGTPPMTMMALIDTGSELTWFQCFPCDDNCYSQILPVFDPLSSKTYKTHSCDSDMCHKLDSSGCIPYSNECTFALTYADESISEGKLATDNFGVVSSDSRDISIPDITFGCSHSAEGIYSENATGIIGLDMGPLSFISQLGDSGKGRFSYCLMRVLPDTDTSSVILFGEDAWMLGPSTRILSLEYDSSMYYLNLLDISVDGDRLNVPPGTFLPKADGGGGLIIDSGAELTYLHAVAYDLLTEKLLETVKLKPWRLEDDEEAHCWEKEDLEDGESIPVVTLHFQGGLNVDLQPWNTFHYWYAGKVCLAIKPVSNSGISIIGALAQQNIHIGYDLKMKEIHMSPANCAQI